MPTGQRVTIDRDVASRALIDLLADLAWAERKAAPNGEVQRTRAEAVALLPRIAQGDREATRRAMELVQAAGRAA